MMSLALGDTGLASGLFCYMDDLIACSPTWEAHLLLLERMFAALQAAGFDAKTVQVTVWLKASKVFRSCHFGT